MERAGAIWKVHMSHLVESGQAHMKKGGGYVGKIRKGVGNRAMRRAKFGETPE